MSLPQMGNETPIEKKISENTWQNQTQIDTGEAFGENWLRKLYIPEPELRTMDLGDAGTNHPHTLTQAHNDKIISCKLQKLHCTRHTKYL